MSEPQFPSESGKIAFLSNTTNNCGIIALQILKSIEIQLSSYTTEALVVLTVKLSTPLFVLYAFYLH
jgi:hypothetical protein